MDFGLRRYPIPREPLDTEPRLDPAF